MPAAASRHDPPHAIVFPELDEFVGSAFERDGDYDAVAFTDCDLREQNGGNSRLTDCLFERCQADGLALRQARLSDCLVNEMTAASLDLTESVWRDCVLSGGRFGALTLAGASLTRVRLRGVKLDFLNLRDAKVEGMVFENCLLGELDAGSARLSDVALEGGRVDNLVLHHSTLQRVDLSRTALHRLGGAESLRGAIVSAAQLMDLAPLLADHLGLTVV